MSLRTLVIWAFFVPWTNAVEEVDPWISEIASIDDINEYHSTESLLIHLIKCPLQDKNVLLVLDRLSLLGIDSDAVLCNHFTSTSSSLTIASQEDFDSENYPTSYISGESHVVILLFDVVSTDFFDRLANDSDWNPTHLIIISTDVNTTASSMIRHHITQRSTYITLFEINKRQDLDAFNMYASYPFVHKGLRFATGMWDASTQLPFDSLFVDRFSSFQGAVLHLASWCDDYPLVYVNSSNDCVGCNLDVLSIIGEKMNFTYIVEKKSADENWGSLENGVWTGMLGDLAYNGRHLVVNYFLVNYDRWKDFDCTLPYHAEGFGFMARRPLPLPQWRNIIYPFDTWMWGAIIFCVVVVSLIFTSLPSMTPEAAYDVFKGSLWIIAGALRQPVIRQLDIEWQRVWLTFWWIGCFILTSAYTGNLIAYLTIPAYPSRVETTQALAASDLRVTMQDYGEFVPEALKKSSDEDLYALGHKLDLFPVEDTFDMHYQKGVNMVMDRTHVLLETYSYLMNVQVLYKVLHDTYLLKAQIYSGHLAWFLPKNTPYTWKISSLLFRLREVGIVQKLFQNHFRHVTASVHDDKETMTPKALVVEQLQGAFLLLIVGLAISCIVFLTEVAAGRLLVKKFIK